MSKWWTIVMCFIATGAISQEDRVTIVRDRSLISTCQPIGRVEASSVIGGIFTGNAYTTSLNAMREKVAAAGGNYLLLTNMNSSYTGANGFGEAYICDGSGYSNSKNRNRR